MRKKRICVQISVFLLICSIFMIPQALVSENPVIGSYPDLIVDGTSITLCGNHSFNAVKIINGGILYVQSYNGSYGTGWLKITANSILIDSASKIVGDGSGWRGGNARVGAGNGYDGEGPGAGGGGEGHGTGYGAGGGGAGYGGSGGNGGCGGATPGAGGSPYGSNTSIHSGNGTLLGSGGGSGGAAVGGGCNVGSYGGNGGGSIYLEAVYIHCNGTITAKGDDGTTTCGSEYDGGGGGGGSGGNIIIYGGEVNITCAILDVTGGAGGRSEGVSGGGGGGGGGRLKIFYSSLLNTSTIISITGGPGGQGYDVGQSGSAGTVYYEQIFPDTTPPNIVVLSPQNETYSSDFIPLTFEIDEPTSWIGYSLDNQPNITISGNTFINVEDGTHQIIVYADDISGNTGSSQIVHFAVNSSFYDPWETSFTGLGGFPIVDFTVCNGTLYAASNSALHIWNGSNWETIDAPTYIISLVCYENKLIIGGQGGLYYYNETQSTLIFPISGYIKGLGTYNNTLYAGTILTSPPLIYYCNGSAENPDNWHIDTTFSTILNFSGPFGSIDSFAVYNDKMYVSSGSTVYCFNGTGWSIAKTYGDVNSFLGMQVYNGKLYLATRDQAWRKPIYQGYSGFSGRVIEFDGNNWTTIFDIDYWIYSLETYDGRLYIGTANRIYSYNGTDWKLSFKATEGAYYAISLITYDGKIYAGMGNGYIFVDPSPKIMQSETVAVPEFPSFVFLPLFMLTMLVAVLIKKKKRGLRSKSY